MSRTTRKPRWYVEHTDVSFINRELERYSRRPYKMAKVRKTDEEFDREMRREVRKYEEAVKKNGGQTTYLKWDFWCKRYVTREIRKPWVSLYRYARVPYTIDECVEEAKREREKLTRDGNMSMSGRRKYFKYLAKKEVRSEWRNMKQKILKGEDYDKYCPHDRLGKKHIWSVW